jgi:hypothetical protein
MRGRKINCCPRCCANTEEQQFSALEEALTAHLRAQSDSLDRLLARLEALFRAPSSEPEAGRRLDS